MSDETASAFWESPRNLAILLAVGVGIVAGLAGYLGYELGSQPTVIVVHFDGPLTLAAPK
jgi:hypothetical protein